MKALLVILAFSFAIVVARYRWKSAPRNSSWLDRYFRACMGFMYTLGAYIILAYLLKVMGWYPD